MTILRRCLDWASHLEYDALPQAAVSNTKNAIFDTVAAMLSGVNEPVSRKILAYAAKERAAGPATVAGTCYRFFPASAALINGTMAHALDYDDVLSSTRSHPSAVLVPAMLAMGEAQGSSGAEIITAYLVGLEIIDKIGSLVAFAQYERGWHTTSTLGVLGAAAGAGKLLRLPELQMRMALGIAASMAGGLQKNFGTMTKPLHAGLAAQAGVMAAMLAADGFTSSDDILSGKESYLEVLTQKTEPARVPSFGEPFAIVSPGLYVKRYPCCAATHRALDAVFNIKSEVPDLDFRDIVTVSCMAPARAFAALICDLPQTGLEGKFSMQYVLSAAFIDGRVTIGSFKDEMVRREDVRSLMPKIKKVEALNLPIADPDGTDRRFTEVTVTTKNGQVLRNRVVQRKGSAGMPLSEHELAEKFLSCSADVFSVLKQNVALSMLLNLDSVQNTSELMATLRLPGEAAAGHAGA